MGVGSSSDVLGASQPLPLRLDLCLQRSTKTLPSMQLSGPVASTIACRSDGRSFASPNILTWIHPERTGHLSWMFFMECTTIRILRLPVPATSRIRANLALGLRRLALVWRGIPTCSVSPHHSTKAISTGSMIQPPPSLAVWNLEI